MDESDFEPEIEMDAEAGFEPGEIDFGNENSGNIEGVSDNDVELRYENNLEHSTHPAESHEERNEGEGNIILEGSYDAETNSITLEGMALQGDPEIIEAIVERFQQGIEGTAYSTEFTYEGGLYQSDYVIEGSTLRIETVLIPKEDEETAVEAEFDDDDSDSSEENETRNIFSGVTELNSSEAGRATAEQAAVAAETGVETEAGTNGGMEIKNEEARSAEHELNLTDLFWIKIDSSVPQRITVKAEKSAAEPQNEIAHTGNNEEFVSLRKREMAPAIEPVEVEAKSVAEEKQETAKNLDAKPYQASKKEVPQDKALKKGRIIQLKREVLEDRRPEESEDEAENSYSTTVQAKKSISKTVPKPVIKLAKQGVKNPTREMGPRPLHLRSQTPRISSPNLETKKSAKEKEISQPVSLSPAPDKVVKISVVTHAQRHETPAHINEPGPANPPQPRAELNDNVNVEASKIFASDTETEQTENIMEVAAEPEADTIIEGDAETAPAEQIEEIETLGQPLEAKILEQDAKPKELVIKKVGSDKNERAEKETHQHIEQARTAIRLVKSEAESRKAANSEVVKRESVKRASVRRINANNNSAERNRKVVELARREKPAEQYQLKRAIRKIVKTGPRFESKTGGIVLKYQRSPATVEERDRLEQNNRIARIPINKVRQRIPGQQRAAIKMAA